MSPDDPRHGTRPGYRAHRKDGEDACAACRRAEAATQARYVLAKNRGLRYAQPVHVVTRRIHALVALGWTNQEIAARAGVHEYSITIWADGRVPTVNAASAARIRRAYDEMSMSLAPDTYGARRARLRASRNGYAPPLAWDDIDNDPAPIGQRHHWSPDYDSRDLIDPATVLRILAGEVLPANAAERGEVVRRWKADGKSEAALCQRLGWKEARYGREAESA